MKTRACPLCAAPMVYLGNGTDFRSRSMGMSATPRWGCLSCGYTAVFYSEEPFLNWIRFAGRSLSIDELRAIVDDERIFESVRAEAREFLDMKVKSAREREEEESAHPKKRINLPPEF